MPLLERLVDVAARAQDQRGEVDARRDRGRQDVPQEARRVLGTREHRLEERVVDVGLHGRRHLARGGDEGTLFGAETSPHRRCLRVSSGPMAFQSPAGRVDVLILTALQDELDAVPRARGGGPPGVARAAGPPWLPVLPANPSADGGRPARGRGGVDRRDGGALDGDPRAVAPRRAGPVLSRHVRHLRGLSQEGGARRRDRGRPALRLRRGQGDLPSRERDRAPPQRADVRPGGDVEDGGRLPGAGARGVGAPQRAPSVEGSAAALVVASGAGAPG